MYIVHITEQVLQLTSKAIAHYESREDLTGLDKEMQAKYLHTKAPCPGILGSINLRSPPTPCVTVH